MIFQSVYVSGKKIAKTIIEKIDAAAAIFRPAADFHFPAHSMYGRTRHFRYQWLNNNKWLAYSLSEDGGYCIPCVFFAHNKSQLGQLVCRPMVNLARASTTLSEHSKQATHISAVKAMLEAELQVKQSVPTIAQRLQSISNDIIAQNKKKLVSIMKTVIFCARQNIALRGHRYESGCVIGGESPGGNPGNFLALLQFRAESGDQALFEHFSSKLVSYQSPLIQNEIIKCTGDWVREKILSEIRQQPFYAISADEAVDCSNKEQMPFVVRFVDNDNHIREEFLDFILCDEGTTGQAIAAKLLEELNICGLSLSKLRGQCFDSASIVLETWPDD